MTCIYIYLLATYVSTLQQFREKRVNNPLKMILFRKWICEFKSETVYILFLSFLNKSLRKSEI